MEKRKIDLDFLQIPEDDFAVKYAPRKFGWYWLITVIPVFGGFYFARRTGIAHKEYARRILVQQIREARCEALKQYLRDYPISLTLELMLHMPCAKQFKAVQELFQRLEKLLLFKNQQDEDELSKYIADGGFVDHDLTLRGVKDLWSSSLFTVEDFERDVLPLLKAAEDALVEYVDSTA